MKLMEFQHIKNRISRYQEGEMPNNVRDEAIVGLTLLHEWLIAGYVDEKTLSTPEIGLALVNVRQGYVDKSVKKQTMVGMGRCI